MDTHKETMAMGLHDMSNYMACLQAGVQSLCESELTPDERLRYKAVLVSCVDKAMGLMRDLMDPGELRRTLLAFEDLVLEAVESFEALFKAKGVALAYEVASSSFLNADRVKLERVLANLLGNALKFTPAGGRVTVRAERKQGRACLSVSDTGIGIADCHKEKVFEKFFQVQPHNHGSLGVGLHIANDIIRSHGGRLAVESPGLGRGSTFLVTLPSLAWSYRRAPRLAGAYVGAPPERPLEATGSEQGVGRPGNLPLKCMDNFLEQNFRGSPRRSGIS